MVKKWIWSFKLGQIVLLFYELHLYCPQPSLVSHFIRIINVNQDELPEFVPVFGTLI